ncbi:hypothetical protein, partial [Actinomyces ruminis]|uniref:hypothetical protein n=1 Tax=Actinomyces ruminis TaxID=1937003 RepID=UPI001C556EEE
MSEIGINAPGGPEAVSENRVIPTITKSRIDAVSAFVPFSDVENVSVCSVLGVCDPISDWRPGWVCPGIDLSA